MKRMKAKLMASLAMLVVAAIMVTSTSYAWYTINTVARVSEMAITLASTQNVEVAKAYFSQRELTAEEKESTTYKDTGITKIDTVTMVEEVTTVDAGTRQDTFGGSIAFANDASTRIQLPAEKIYKVKDFVVDATKPDAKTNQFVYDTAIAPASWNATGKDKLDEHDNAYEHPTDDKKMRRIAYSYSGETLYDGMAGIVYDETGRTGGFRMATPVTDSETGLTTYQYSYDANNPDRKATIALSYNMFVRTNVDGTISISSTKADGASDAAQVSFSYAAMGTLIGSDYKTGVTNKDNYFNGKVLALDTDTAALNVTGEDKTLYGGAVYDVPTLTTVSLNSFEAKANVVYLVQIFAYIDGEQVTAEDFTDEDGNLVELTATLTNIKFTNSTIASNTQNELQSWELANLLEGIKYDETTKKVVGLADNTSLYNYADVPFVKETKDKTEVIKESADGYKYIKKTSLDDSKTLIINNEQILCKDTKNDNTVLAATDLEPGDAEVKLTIRRYVINGTETLQLPKTEGSSETEAVECYVVKEFTTTVTVPKKVTAATK